MLFKESIKRFTPPKGWSWASIGDVAKLSFSSVDKKTVEGENAVRLCNYMDVFHNRRIREGMPFMVSTASDSDIKKFTLNKGDVVLTKDSETPEEIAFAAVIDEQIDNLVCGYHLAVLRPDKTKVIGEYLMSAINFHPNHHQFVRLANGATRFGLGIDSLNNALLPIPPLAEQRKIAEILRTWDEAIETAEAEHESLVKQLNGLVQSLALRIPEGKAPNGWVDRQIGDLVVEVDRRVEWDDDMTYKLVSCARRSGGIFHREDKLGSEIAVKKMQEIRSGDFILSRMQVLHGGWAMVEPDFAGHHVSDMYMILEPRTDRLYMSYFDWISRTSWMRHLAYLASYGVHIEKMTFVPKLFLNSKVRIPDSIAEQKRIAEILDGFSQKVEISSALLELLRNQKRGLMQKLLTGEVRVAA